MAKSKCEQQLDQMRQERDHWRKVAQDSAAQLADAKRALERMGDMASALASSGGIAEKYQIQRDEIQDRLNAHIDGVQQIADRYSQDAATQQCAYEERVKNLTAPYEYRRSLPVLVEWSLHASQGIADFVEDMYAHPDALAEIQQSPSAAAVYNLAAATGRAATWRLCNLIVAFAHNTSREDDLKFLAAEILRQWEQDDIDPTLVAILCSKWKDGPNPQTMLKAFRVVKEFNGQDKTQAVWCGLQNPQLHERTLQNYLKYVDAVRELATVPKNYLDDETEAAN